MMAGGRPEEKEVFYLSFRRGGLMFMPVDPETAIREMIPNPTSATVKEECALLQHFGFNVTEKMLWDSVDGSSLEVLYATPFGEYAAPREPVATVRAPQAIASWLEPLVSGRFSYQMQVATAYIKAREGDTMPAFLETIRTVTCERQKELTMEAILGAHKGRDFGDADFRQELRDIENGITVDELSYYNAVQLQGIKMLASGVSPNRIFEVGLRAATCMEQHLIALKALKDLGFTLTSNAYGAYVLDIKAVGTLGHEGIMRHGGNDERAFRAHIAAMPLVIMLLDTNDTMKVGIPTALKLMEEFPDRNDGMRPDSGSLEEQFRYIVSEIKARGIRPRPWVFEDGIDDKDVARYEALRIEVDYPEEVTLFGAGGYFIDRPEPTGYRRGLVSMVYKLAWTSKYGPTMKFGDELEEGWSGKQSLPGIPVLAVRENAAHPSHGPATMVCQYGNLPKGWRVYGPGDSARRDGFEHRPAVDGITLSLIETCTRARAEAVAAAA